MKFLVLALALFGAAMAQQYQGAPIAILRQAQDISPDGSYRYNFETENGISVSEDGQPGPLNEDGQPAVVAQGSYAYSSPEGVPIFVSYTANENGFQPQGAHLPVPPPIPPQILRALEYINANAGRSQGSFRPNQGFNRF